MRRPIVGNVIAKVGHGRVKYWGDPQCVHPQSGEVLQCWGQPWVGCRHESLLCLLFHLTGRHNHRHQSLWGRADTPGKGKLEFTKPTMVSFCWRATWYIEAEFHHGDPSDMFGERKKKRIEINNDIFEWQIDRLMRKMAELKWETTVLISQESVF